MRSRSLSAWLERQPPQVFSIYCIVAAFGTYFCMYAFRKPFTAATFDGMEAFGYDYKTLLITSQLLGYTLSKFVGIRILSELSARWRAGAILLLIAIAHLSLLLFAWVPAPYNVVFLFVNGLPLGMVFGLVLGFLEGRRLTELLTAGLCASFIVSSGVVKSVGQYLLQAELATAFTMPFYAGALFVLPLLASVWLLAQIPPPGVHDVAERSLREPIDVAQRWHIARMQAWGLGALVLVYTLLTVLRSIRDDFAVEIWTALGYGGIPGMFARSETIVMFAVLVLSGSLFLIRDNRVAFRCAILFIATGFAVILAACFALQAQWLGGFAFMVLLGIGAYLPYVVFHTSVFERIIALTRERANLAYFMYVADAFGYLGYVFLLFGKSALDTQTNYLGLLEWVAILIALTSIALVLFTAHYYQQHFANVPMNALPEEAQA